MTSDPEAPKVCPSCAARYPLDALFCSLDGAPLTTSRGGIAAAAASDPYVGREILDHIEIRHLVGIGAMGRVYRAFQKGIDRDVAVKVLHRELSSNQTLVARFHREAKVASRLAHPNVVHVLLAGQLPDGAMYIVMEYLDGMSLQSALGAAAGALPLPRALHIALQLCEAAGEGHQQGVVHRDLKPENVMLVLRADDPDFVKVLDFGIARLNWGETSMATAAGLIFGTARYISPEGARGDQVGPEGDVYSIATMLYQMLAGRAPFEAEQAVALLVQQIHDAPHDLRSLPRASYVPEAIAAVVMRNLSKRPDERAPNGRAFARDLLDAAVASGMSAQEILTRRAMLGGARGSSPSAVKMPSMQRTQQMALEGDGRAPAPTSLEAPESMAMQGMRSVEARAGATQVAETPASSVRPSAASAAPGVEARPLVRTEIVDRRSAPPSLPGGSTTTRWSPPSDFERRIQPTPPSKPPSSVDATLAGDTPAPQTIAPAPPALRGPLLVALCFFVGVSGLALLAGRLGAFGHASVQEARAGAQAPPVKELLPEAVHDPNLPSTPDNAPAPVPPLDAPVPRASGPHASATAQAPGSASPGPVRVTIDASASHPNVGQPVDFAGHAASAAGAGGGAHRLESARFRIVGPGITQGTELPAFDDGTGMFRTTFTFLQAGRFDVQFAATADGAAVHSARAITVGDATAEAPPPPAAPGPPSAPPPTAPAPGPSPATTKWL